MNIKIHKKGLILYLSVLAASVVFSSFRGGPLSYAWLYAVLLLLPLSALYIFLNYSFLRVFQEIEVHKVTRDEDYRFRAVIENAGFLPIHKMQLLVFEDRCNLYEIGNGQVLSLDIREKKELRSGISCRYAGSYDIGIQKAAFTDPFSVFTVEMKIPFTFRAVVSPPVTDIADPVLDLENPVNNTGLKSNRLPENTPGSDLRPYQRGDSLNSINWKVSARLSEWMVRVPDKMEKRSVTILMLAAFAPEKEQDIDYLKKRDYFLEFAVSAAWHFGRQGVPVRLIYPAGKVSECIVDSYESFMDFYGTAADGIFYSSKQEYEKLRNMTQEQRSTAYDNGTRILIKEDPEPGESHFVICE